MAKTATGLMVETLGNMPIDPIELSPRDWERFWAVMEAETQPTPQQIATMRAYLRRVGLLPHA